MPTVTVPEPDMPLAYGVNTFLGIGKGNVLTTASGDI
mgnify:CR=1 FL=1